VTLLLDRIKFVMVRGDQRDVEPFCQRSCTSVGTGSPRCHLHIPNPLDTGIIGVATRGRARVLVHRLGGGTPVSTEKIIVSLPEIADRHG
jgi:hypothetical protein